MPAPHNLGRLEPVDVRKVWPSESAEFTPWLALPENILLLGETIGMELEVAAQEADVGQFRADILCRETATGAWVLVENQLAKTDHVHLGQLLTYAAGLDAVTIVWVASRFTGEHRAALDWLNEITAEKFQFFGLEVEAWRIGSSPPAPKFNVVSKPNDWTRDVRETVDPGHTETGKLQLEFWRGFKAYADQNAKRFRAIKPLAQAWMTIAIGRTGFNLSGVVSTWSPTKESYGEGELRATLYIDHRSAGEAFAKLREEKDAIQAEVGEDLHWYEVEGVKARKIFARRSITLANCQEWPESFKWLTEKLDRLHAAFQSRVKALVLGEGMEEGTRPPADPKA